MVWEPEDSMAFDPDPFPFVVPATQIEVIAMDTT